VGRTSQILVHKRIVVSGPRLWLLLRAGQRLAGPDPLPDVWNLLLKKTGFSIFLERKRPIPLFFGRAFWTFLPFQKNTPSLYYRATSSHWPRVPEPIQIPTPSHFSAAASKGKGDAGRATGLRLDRGVGGNPGSAPSLLSLSPSGMPTLPPSLPQAAPVWPVNVGGIGQDLRSFFLDWWVDGVSR
jgi:hypothetical protein